MLLWTTVFWMFFNSRINVIIILLLAISMILFEYTSIVIGIDLLNQVFGSHFKERIFDKQLTLDILIKVS